MKWNGDRFPRRDARALGLVLLAGALLLGVGIGGYDLWPADEPRFAEVAREMYESGDYLVPRVNNQLYTEKPPLLFWLIALASAPFGEVTATTARIPSVVSALATLACTFLLARSLFGRQTALWAALVLMTNVRFWWQARTAQIDMLLTACMALALLAFWYWRRTSERRWLLVFYAAVTGGLFAKGPVALLFPLLLMGAFYWRRRGERRAMHPLMGFGAAVLLVLLWWVPSRMAITAGSEATAAGALGADLYRQVIGRVFLGVSKAQPPWYYLWNLPVDLLPWTVFLPWTIYWAWKNRKGGGEMRLLLAWTVPAFLVMSAISGKRALYLLPLFPALAILIGRGVVVLGEQERSPWRTIAGWGWVAFAALAGLAPLTLLFSPHRDAFTPAALLIVAAGLGLAIESAVQMVRGGGRRLAFRVAGGFAVLALLAALIVFPVMNRYKSARSFCAPMRRMHEAGVDYRLYSVLFSREEYVFYCKRFHEPFLVEEFPRIEHETLAPEEVNAQLQMIARGLQRTAAEVPISDIRNVTREELDALEGAGDALFAFAREKTDLGDAPKRVITRAVEAFAGEFAADTPAFFFVQNEDWRWLLALAPGLARFEVVRAESVGSRDVLLVANEAGAELLADQEGQRANAPSS